jgi:hypothetical protein
VLELNPALVTRMIAGLKARAAVKTADGRSAPEIRQRIRANEAEVAKLTANRDEDRQRYNDERNRAVSCRDEYMTGLKAKQQETIQRLIMTNGQSNMQLVMQLSQYSADIAQAQAAGDTAAARKATAAYYKALGMDPVADSIQADKSCNVPPPPPWMARADSLTNATSKLYEEVRNVEVEASAAAVKVTGLSAEQYAMALERVTAYVELAGGARGLWKFSTIEEQALAAKIAELKVLV